MIINRKNQNRFNFVEFSGFLNLGLKECSGNQAIKDVIMSLEWIKENIKSFGGDPDNITILGSSSGAALIHCLMLSPKTKGSEENQTKFNFGQILHRNYKRILYVPRFIS